MKFTASQFVATQWETAEQKAKFANKFVSFVNNGCNAYSFSKWFYQRLSNCFGHIAHYNLDGFYDTHFRDIGTKIDFLQICSNWECYGDPAYTYSDVEKALQPYIREKIRDYVIVIQEINKYANRINP